MSATRILFVYNADSGLLSALKDMVHKAASPATYPCSLCATTYGAVAMRPEWKTYVADLPHEAVFLHRDELSARHPGLEQPLPAVLLERDGAVDVLLGPGQLPLGQTVAELRQALDRALGRDTSPSD